MRESMAAATRVAYIDGVIGGAVQGALERRSGHPDRRSLARARTTPWASWSPGGATARRH